MFSWIIRNRRKNCVCATEEESVINTLEKVSVRIAHISYRFKRYNLCATITCSTFSLLPPNKKTAKQDQNLFRRLGIMLYSTKISCFSITISGYCNT